MLPFIAPRTVHIIDAAYSAEKSKSIAMPFFLLLRTFSCMIYSSFIYYLNDIIMISRCQEQFCLPRLFFPARFDILEQKSIPSMINLCIYGGH